MSLEKKLRAKYKEQLNIVDDVEELVLDELTNVQEISESDKKYLERFSGLSTLSMNYLGLSSLKNLPKIPGLTELQLNENAIATGLEQVAIYPKLKGLELLNNKIADLKQLDPLKSLKELERLTVDGCPITEEENYRESIFKALPQVKFIDGKDPDGKDWAAENPQESSQEESKSEHEKESEEEESRLQEDSSVQVVEPEEEHSKAESKHLEDSDKELNLSATKNAANYSINPFGSQNIGDGFMSLPGYEYNYEPDDFEVPNLGKRPHTMKEELFGDPNEDSDKGMRCPVIGVEFEPERRRKEDDSD